MSTPSQIKKAADKAARELLIVADSDKLSGQERDAIGLVRWACQEIADGER